MHKDYLGDSVYAETDGNGITLTTENGLPTDPSNTIYLELEVIDALNRYVARLKAMSAAEARSPNEKLSD